MPTAAVSERSKLLGRAGIVGAGTLASRVLGVARDMAMLAVFQRATTDAFYVAFTIPNALRQLLAEGPVSGAVVPVLSATLDQHGEEEARSFFAKMRGASLLALVLVTIAGVLGARPLTLLFADGYQGEELERTVGLTRVMFPYIFFMGTAALGMAALHARRRFAVAAFAPALLNVAFLIAVFLFPAPLARAGIDTAYALALGALLGGFLQAAVQWPALRAIGYAGLPRLDLADPRVREVLRRMVPMMAGVGVYYVDLVLSRRFLSELGAGAQSYFTVASRVCDFPQGIFVMALSTAALPSLSASAARGAMDDVADTFAHGMRLALFVALPASVALVTLAEPVVVTIFQRGAFDPLAAHETARALAWQGAALWTVAAVRQLVPVLNALGDTRSPAIVGALDLLAFIGLAFGLKGPMGHVGISAAVAGSSAVQMVLLTLLVARRLPTGTFAAMIGSILRSLAASVAAAGAGLLVARLMTGQGHLIGVAAGGAFAVAFVAAAWVLRSEELAQLGGGLARRLGRRVAT